MFERTKHIAKLGIGKLCCGLFPQRKAAMLDSFTLPYWDERLTLDFVDRVIRYSIYSRLRLEKEAVESVHRGFWRAARTTAWYGANNNRLHHFYIPNYGKFVSEVASKLLSSPVNSMVEFGAGDGSWLNYLSSQFDGIKNFTGVDLSRNQTERNREKWPEIRFECDDLLAWLRREPKDNTLYHTNSGVFEYLSGRSVFEVLSLIKKAAREGAVFLIEPVSMDYDLESGRDSLPLGPELSFSHNYRHMLTTLDFDIQLYSEIIVPPYRMVVVFAKA